MPLMQNLYIKQNEMMLKLAAKVYADLSEEEINEIEPIVSDRAPYPSPLTVTICQNKN